MGSNNEEAPKDKNTPSDLEELEEWLMSATESIWAEDYAEDDDILFLEDEEYYERDTET